MRPLVLLLLLSGLAACGFDDGTGPDATLITGRLRNEIGANAGANYVFVTTPASMRLERRTEIDGTVRIRVQEPGVYRIRVVPRNGFVASELHTRDVTVGANEHVVVDFTLFRAGSNLPPPGGESTGR